MSSQNLRKTVEKLLENLKQDSSQSKQMNATAMSGLYDLFGVTLHLAMDLVEKGNVVLLKTIKNREIFRVKSKYQTYTCFKHSYYCSCRAFKYKVVQKKGMAFCKHLLASRIAEVLDRYAVNLVSDEDLIKFCKSFVDESGVEMNSDDETASFVSTLDMERSFPASQLSDAITPDTTGEELTPFSTPN